MSRTILIVDDSVVIRSVIKIYLEPFGYRFVEAQNGEQALEVAREAALDLVIADVNMPKRNGLSFVEELRNSERVELRRVPVIFLSSEKDPSILKRGKGLATAFLPKPVSSAGLVAAVTHLFPGEQRSN